MTKSYKLECWKHRNWVSFLYIFVWFFKGYQLVQDLWICQPVWQLCSKYFTNHYCTILEHFPCWSTSRVILFCYYVKQGHPAVSTLLWTPPSIPHSLQRGWALPPYIFHAGAATLVQVGCWSWLKVRWPLNEVHNLPQSWFPAMLEGIHFNLEDARHFDCGWGHCGGRAVQEILVDLIVFDSVSG